MIYDSEYGYIAIPPKDRVDPIQRIFTGKHIDLSKVVSIGDAYFIDRMGSGGLFVGFDIDVQLLEKPIRYTRKLDDHEEDFARDNGWVLVRMVDTRLVPLMDLNQTDHKELMCVVRLQNQIDELVGMWKEVRKWS